MLGIDLNFFVSFQRLPAKVKLEQNQRTHQKIVWYSCHQVSIAIKAFATTCLQLHLIRIKNYMLFHFAIFNGWRPFLISHDPKISTFIDD